MPEYKFGKYKVETSHEEKILFGDKITKGDLIEYYSKISKYMIPLIKDRPLMMHRFPSGIEHEGFYQKNVSDYFPDWIQTVKVPIKEGENNFVLCQNTATLIYLANQACIVPHIWLSKKDKLNFPDKIVFDLDPSKDDFSTVCFIALELKKILENMGLASFAMTTGSKGIHIVIPIDRKLEFIKTREFAIKCANILLKKFPDITTLELRKDKREDKVFIDTFRNQYGATSVAPYAVRAKPGAPVATPVDWLELKDKKLTPDKYNIFNIFKKLEKFPDPWENIKKIKQNIKKLL